jgi:hypothetical protein
VTVEVWLWLIRQRKVETVEAREQKARQEIRPFGEHGSRLELNEQNRRILKTFENLEKKDI